MSKKDPKNKSESVDEQRKKIEEQRNRIDDQAAAIKKQHDAIKKLIYGDKYVPEGAAEEVVEMDDVIEEEGYSLKFIKFKARI